MMKCTVVLVHGAGQSTQSPEMLTQIWTASLRRGIEKSHGRYSHSRVLLAYYGDLCGTAVPLIPATRALGGEAAFRRELHRQVVPRRRSAATRLAALATGLPGGRHVLNIFSADAYSYLNSPTLRERVDRRVLASITEAGRNSVIVAHSLGSIVSVRVLAAGQLSCRALITLGSPLAVPVVQRYLDFNPWHAFRATDVWINAADHRDWVTGGRALDRSTLKQEGNNKGILNILDVNNRGLQHHDIEGYLSDPAVGHALGTLCR